MKPTDIGFEKFEEDFVADLKTMWIVPGLKECDNKCDYAKTAKENKELANNAIIFPQTIGDITYYSKEELFEWVKNQQTLNKERIRL